MSNLYELFKKYQVEANSIEDFINKYGKHNRYAGRGEEYMKVCIESHKEHLREYGFDFITHHDSKTGEIVSYYGNE
jgi:hypothetical protein